MELADETTGVDAMPVALDDSSISFDGGLFLIAIVAALFIAVFAWRGRKR